MSKILVLAGGNSNEREVSLRSGAAVAAALTSRGHHVAIVDPAQGIDLVREKAQQAEAVFLALHGAGGEDGSIQKELEILGVPFVGPGSAASALCLDKTQFKQLLVTNHVITPADAVVTSATLWTSPLTGEPFVLKPIDGGSSIDIFIVRNVAEIDKDKIEEAFSRHPHMLLEELIEGVEVTVGILGEQALLVVEIVPPPDGEFDYENKYNGKTQELCPPEHVTSEKQAEVQNIALQIHKITGCRDLSRTDFMLGHNGTFYALDTNTLPGMTDQSLYPKAAKAAGLDFADLCDQLVNMALARPAKA